MFLDNDGNAVCATLAKKLSTRANNTRARPGKFEVFLLQPAHVSLIPTFKSLAVKAFKDFVSNCFNLYNENAATTRPCFFITSSHSHGKKVIDPRELVNVISLNDFGIEFQILTAFEPESEGENSTFIVQMKKNQEYGVEDFSRKRKVEDGEVVCESKRRKV
jgi:isopropylmalate/homocitrate/citramalate synthase